jgi:hypothetical protein
MLKRIFLGLGLSAWMLGAAGAAESHFEITPFFTERGDGGFRDATNNDVNLSAKSGMAVAFGWPASEHGSQYELLYSRQSTKTDGMAPIDMRIEYLQLGGSTLLGDEESHVVPFASGGIGVTRFSPGITSLTQETRWAASLGAGIRIPIVKHVRLRFEARGYLTWLDGSSSLFCSSSTTTTCVLHAKGQTFFQYEALGGVSIGF